MTVDQIRDEVSRRAAQRAARRLVRGAGFVAAIGIAAVLAFSVGARTNGSASAWSRRRLSEGAAWCSRRRRPRRSGADVSWPGVVAVPAIRGLLFGVTQPITLTGVAVLMAAVGRRVLDSAIGRRVDPGVAARR
jgi:hypothetical protein